MKKLLFLLTLSAVLFSCAVTWVPTKSDTALNLVSKIQQEANNAFYTIDYNDAAYSIVNADIDSLISFDKSRIKSGDILKQDSRIQVMFKNFQYEHKTKGSIAPSEQNTYKAYFKSVIDPRIISEKSFK